MSEYQRDSRSGWFQWLAPLFGGSVQAVVGALVMLFTVGVFGIVIKDAIVSNSKDKTGVRRIIAHR